MTTNATAWRMEAPAPEAGPAGWSPVGWDLRATGGTKAILARVRLGAPITTGATMAEVTAAGRLLAYAPECMAALRALVVWDTPDHPDHDAMVEMWHDRLVARDEQPSGARVREVLLEAARDALARLDGKARLTNHGGA